MKDDVISRQAAIDALGKREKELRNINWYNNPYAEGECEGISYAMDVIRNTPSAQPELSEIKRDLSDLISRQDAINIVAPYDEGREMRDALEDLPSAQPDRTEIIRCKDCNKASKCYGDVIMRSRGGGNIYCPLEFCSEAERRTDERIETVSILR